MLYWYIIYSYTYNYNLNINLNTGFIPEEMLNKALETPRTV